jgi:hypothetical protein
MLHACAARFDVIFWGENFWELNTPSKLGQRLMEIACMLYGGFIWLIALV